MEPTTGPVTDRAAGGPADMRLADVVATSQAVAATRSRTAKVRALASRLAQARPDEVEALVGLLTGVPRQGSLGVGWATVRAGAAPPAGEPALTVLDVDRALDGIVAATGAGSTAERQRRLEALLARATAAEQTFLHHLLLGDLRQGALAGLMAEAVATAHGIPADLVRRAAMLTGDLGRTAVVAATGGDTGLRAVGLEVLRPVQPMLARTAPGVAAAVTAPASVEWKLDGARIQVHRLGSTVRVFTRNLNDITERLPVVVEAVLAMPAERLVLDGEAIGVDADLRPRRFQDTMRTFGRDEGDVTGTLRPFFFDVLHADGADLLDEPLARRLEVLAEVTGPWRVPSLVTADAAEAEAFAAQALAQGHEGVVVKALDAPYEAGRRGGAWQKVKPVRTLDLVVLAAEWGHGRRRGWLSNLHLGARRPGDGSFVMVGKTFKGLTDALLAWQTERLQQLEIGREGIVVHVRPELVVEVALDGVQVSPRYPGGVALRFARVRRYRDDKRADDADTIDTVRALLAPAGPR